ncbi:MAG: DivIVA domain-containing protein [Bacteroidia bacterium]|nr:DivIVA domain-containing protein [Bacteroidia bacterium]MDW8158436.1 DivIVA domain-containing protein [Bacteroidia bacterium]
MITPIEIRQHTFSKSIRGYDTEEVKTFLKNLSDIWAQEIEEKRRLQLELEKAKESLQQYREMESLLQRTLMQAEQTSKNTIENAQREAALFIKEAQQKANEIIQHALAEKRKNEKEIEELLKRKKEIVIQLKNFLTLQLQSLEAFEQPVWAPTFANPESKMDFTPQSSTLPTESSTSDKKKTENREDSFFDEILLRLNQEKSQTLADIFQEL